METERLMIARFEGGPYDGLTVEVHEYYKDFQAMGLMPVEAAVVLGSPYGHTHELVAGQYVTQEVPPAQLRVFKWDGPDVEMAGYVSSTVLLVDDPDAFVERRTDGDRRAGHTMGRRSLRGDRRGHRDHAVGWRELRRIEQRRDPKNQRREDH